MRKLNLTVTFLSVLVVGAVHYSFAKEKFNDGDRSWSRDKVKRYIRRAFAGRSEKEIKKIIAVFDAESGLKCSKISKSNDIGVAQINKIHWKRFGGKDRLKSCKHNIDSAKIIYKEWGNSLKAWTSYNNGKYKNYL